MYIVYNKKLQRQKIKSDLMSFDNNIDHQKSKFLVVINLNADNTYKTRKRNLITLINNYQRIPTLQLPSYSETKNYEISSNSQ